MQRAPFGQPPTFGPFMNDLNRDKFYSAGTGDDDDDGPEYEVEPPDPDVLTAERRRAEEIVAASERAVNVDDIYDELEGRRDKEYFDELVRNFRFRFQVKHLLIATTVVAVMTALAVQRNLGAVFVLAMLVAVGGITVYLSWREEQRQAALEKRRQEVYAKRRAQMPRHTEWQKGPDTEPDDQTMYDEPGDEPDADQPATPVRKRFRLRFTLAEMMVAVACAGVLIAIVKALNLALAATFVGVIALGGLVLHAVGFDPPRPVAIGWWVVLLLYVLLSIIAVLWGGM